VVFPDPLSPTPSTFFAMKTPENIADLLTLHQNIQMSNWNTSLVIQP
jgi:hypothetical protein